MATIRENFGKRYAFDKANNDLEQFRDFVMYRVRQTDIARAIGVNHTSVRKRLNNPVSFAMMMIENADKEIVTNNDRRKQRKERRENGRINKATHGDSKNMEDRNY